MYQQQLWQQRQQYQFTNKYRSNARKKMAVERNVFISTFNLQVES